MKLWPFQKKNEDVSHAAAQTEADGMPLSDSVAEPGQAASAGEYELVIPVTPEESFQLSGQLLYPEAGEVPVPEAAPAVELPNAGMKLLASPPQTETPLLTTGAPNSPLLDTSLPRLNLIHPPLPEAPLPRLEITVPVSSGEPLSQVMPVAEPAADVQNLGDFYGEAYESSGSQAVLRDVALPETPPPVAVEIPRAQPVQPVVRDARLAPMQTGRRPSETSHEESIADALTDFEKQIIWEDNQFLNRSINDLVERYFAQREEDEPGQAAV